MADNFQNNKNAFIINRSSINSGGPEHSDTASGADTGQPDWVAIKQLIGNNRLDAAFDKLEPRVLALGDAQLENDFFQLKSTYTDFHSTKNQTTLPDAAKKAAREQLVHHLLQLVDNLKKFSN